MKRRLRKLTLKERIIKRLSIDKVIPENVITQVISHQFNSANKALHNNNTVELSGFGKFIFNKRKANVRLKELIKLKKFYEKEIDNRIEEKKKEIEEKKLKKAEEIKTRRELILKQKEEKRKAYQRKRDSLLELRRKK